MTYKYLTYFLFLFAFSFSWSQEPKYFKFDTENGLPTNEIYQAYETKSGNLIIAHDLGVTLYDGNTFSSVIPKGMKEGTSCYGIKKIEDKLWFRFSNKQLFYFENNQFIPYKFNSILEGLDFMAIFDFQFKNNHLFIAAENGFFEIDAKGNSLSEPITSNKVIIDEENEIMKRFIKLNHLHFSLNWKDTIIETNLQCTVHSHYGKAINSNNHYYVNDVIFSLRNDEIIVFQMPNPTLSIDTSLYHPNKIVSIQKNKDLFYVSTRFGGLYIVKEINGKLEIVSNFLIGKYVGILSFGASGLWVPTLKSGLLYFPNYEIKNFKTPEKVRHIYPVNNSTLFVMLLQNKDDPIRKITSNFSIEIVDSFQYSSVVEDLLPRHLERHNHKSLIAGLSLISQNSIKFRAPRILSYDTDSIYLDFSQQLISYYNKKTTTRDSIAFLNESLNFAIQLNPKEFLIAGEFGLKKIYIKQDKLTSELYPNSQASIQAIQKINDSIIAYNTNNEIGLYNLNQMSIGTSIYKNKQSVIKCFLLQDSLLCIGTKGYLEIRNLNNQNSCVFNNANGLQNSNIVEIKASKENLILATENGISYIPFTLIQQEIIKAPIDYNSGVRLKMENEEVIVDFAFNNLNPFAQLEIQYRLNDGEYINQSGKKLSFLI